MRFIKEVLLSKMVIAALWFAGGVAFAQTPSVLHRFTSTAGGCAPESTLTEVSPGVFFGTTYGGVGIATDGTIFSITSGGQYTELHDFNGPTEGANPQGALLNARDGNLYGITTGQVNLLNPTIFRSDQHGNVTVLYTFAGGAQNFLLPSPLIEANNGGVYGTTSQLPDAEGNSGTFYELTSGGITVLHTFNGSEGTPNGPVIQATDGNFYGLTTVGAYRMTSAGAFTQLAGVGSQPIGSLFEAANEKLYGVAEFDSVFDVTLEGMYTNLYNFTGENDGAYPTTALMQATDGNLYGTTSEDGTNGLGTIYRITPGGALTTLYEFTSAQGGLSFSPDPAMIQGSNGILYGLAFGSCGSIYSLNLGLTAPKPRVKFFYPTSGGVGAGVFLDGANFLGATSVDFNGIPAKYLVRGVNYIVAAVPAGATTGKISVTTPNGTAVSATSFTVN
jgi:uncharacterized repeat protein (TIGR03803 family)